MSGTITLNDAALPMLRRGLHVILLSAIDALGESLSLRGGHPRSVHLRLRAIAGLLDRVGEDGPVQLTAAETCLALDALSAQLGYARDRVITAGHAQETQETVQDAFDALSGLEAAAAAVFEPEGQSR